MSICVVFVPSSTLQIESQRLLTLGPGPNGAEPFLPTASVSTGELVSTRLYFGINEPMQMRPN